MLFPLFQSRGVEQQSCDLNVVAVPGVGLSPPSEWTGAPNSPWLQTVTREAAPLTRIWEFRYEGDQRGSLAVRLIAAGDELAAALLENCGNAESGRKPLVLVCHSTGGFVVKRALCVCRSHHFHYRSVIDVIAGAVFLSVPHFIGNKAEAKKTFDLMLKCQHRGLGRDLSSVGDVDKLIEICKNFESVGLRVPVLSAYESAETSTQRSLFSIRLKGKNSVIVPEAVGVLHTTMETRIDSNANHVTVCHVEENSNLYQETAKLLRSALDHAERRLRGDVRRDDVPIGLRDGSLRSRSTIEGTLGPDILSLHTSLPISSPQGGATGGSHAGSFEFVPSQNVLQHASRDPKLPCFAMGTRKQTDFFVGREEDLRVIDEYLLPDSHVNPAAVANRSSPALRSFAICGLGGMGKTQLAVEYAYSRRDKFNAIFWLNADKSDILAENFASITKDLQLDDDFSDLAACRDVTMGWLAEPLRKRSQPDSPENLVNWLIIFDNLDHVDDVLPDFWPRFGRGSILVTSRDHFAKHSMYINNGIDLAPLSSNASMELMEHLTHITANHPQKEALLTLSIKLDGLPLAICQLSGIFRHLRLSSYSSFLRYLNEEGIQGIFEKYSEPIDSQKIRTLATVWSLDKVSNGTRALLQVVSLLDPDNIPEELLIDKRRVVKLDGYPKTRTEYLYARSELVSSSLINPMPVQRDAVSSVVDTAAAMRESEAGDLERMSIHRLIQDTTKSMMTEETLRAAFEAAIDLVLVSWPMQDMREHHSVARLGTCESIFPSVLRLRIGLEGILDHSMGFLRDSRAAKLFNDTGWYLFERGLMAESIPFCEFGLLLGNLLESQEFEGAEDSVRESHGFLGIILVETNEHQRSMRHKQKWLDILLKRKSANGHVLEDYELGYAYNEIGVAYGNEGLLDQAAAAFRRSIEIFQGLPDYSDTMLGWPEPNLGFIYWMQGKLGEAEEVLVDILDIHAAAYGVDDTKSFKTGKILYGMGNVLEAQGRYDESFSFHRRCLEQFAKVLGRGHHRFGDICHKVAGHYMRQGQYKEARNYLDSALKIFNSRPYLANERTRTTYRKGKLLLLLGEADQGNMMLTEAYEMRKKLRVSDVRLMQQLGEADFDELVVFWSR